MMWKNVLSEPAVHRNGPVEVFFSWPSTGVVIVFLWAVVAPIVVANSPAEIAAFPGAEGYGAYTVGGRRGEVFEVTSLNDDGRGSLRQAVESPGPRIIVFRISGNVELRSNITISRPYITIAGQTAPGDGICLKNCQMKIETHDVVVRHLRFRPGDVSGRALDALTGDDCRNVIIDHCSASWSVDECVTFYHNNNVTIQWCLISESLFDSCHPKGEHGYGGIWGGSNASLHHNLFAHHSSRNPRFAEEDKNIDFRNNVIYNWGFNSAYGGEGATVNMIANYFKPGPATRERVKDRIVEPYGSEGRWYIAENFVVGCPVVTEDNRAGVHSKADRSKIEAETPFPSAPVTTHTAQEAYRLVLAGVGATLPRRDCLDVRIIEQVRSGTATYGGNWGAGRGIIDSQRAVGGWPELTSEPAPLDSDHDGMPDDWEEKYSLAPDDFSDGAADTDEDGYTNVEEYLNGTDPGEYIDYTDPANNRSFL